MRQRMVSDGIVICEILNFLLKISAAFVKLFFNEVSNDSGRAHFIYFSTGYAYNYFYYSWNIISRSAKNS